MPLFIETIKLLNGEFYNLEYHQARIERTFAQFFETTKPFPIKLELDEVPAPRMGLFKCRVVYESEITEVVFQPYLIKPIHSLKLVEANEMRYDFKFENREELKKMYEKRQMADDIIIIKDNIVTDSSYANLIFKRLDKWVTPKNPLLPGTMRQKLIDEREIVEEQILLADIGKYEKVKLINSMLGWEGPEVETTKIIF